MSYLSELRKIVGHRPLLSAGATVIVMKDNGITGNMACCSCNSRTVTYETCA